MLKILYILGIVFFFSMLYGHPLEGKTVRNVFDQEYDAILIDLIQKAKVCIYASHFTFSTEEGVCNEILQSLIAASQKGVSVTLFLEGKKKGAREKNINAEKKFKGTGVKVVLNSSRRLAHAKIFVVDGEWVLAGSTNLSFSSMKKNHEANILIKSQKIAQAMEKYIKELIANPDREIIVESEMENQIKAISDKSFFSYALDMIQNAKKEICITTYLFDFVPSEPDSNISRLFQEIVNAHKRGVKIRIFLEQSSFSFNEHIHQKNWESAQFLNSQGIEGIRFDKAKQITHCKIILTDKNRALVGSTNWYSHDINFGHQVNFIIEENSVIAGLVEYFDNLYGAGVVLK